MANLLDISADCRYHIFQQLIKNNVIEIWYDPQSYGACRSTDLHVGIRSVLMTCKKLRREFLPLVTSAITLRTPNDHWRQAPIPKLPISIINAITKVRFTELFETYKNSHRSLYSQQLTVDLGLFPALKSLIIDEYYEYFSHDFSSIQFYQRDKGIQDLLEKFCAALEKSAENRQWLERALADKDRKFRMIIKGHAWIHGYSRLAASMLDEMVTPVSTGLKAEEWIPALLFIVCTSACGPQHADRVIERGY